MKNITPINPNVVPEPSNQNSSRPIEAEQQSVVQQPALAQPEVPVQEISQEVPQNPLPQKPQPQRQSHIQASRFSQSTRHH